MRSNRANIFYVTIYILNILLVTWLKKPLFLKSFAEGNSINTLEISSNKPLDKMASSPLLISHNYSADGYNYRLASSNANILKALSQEYSANSDVNGIKFIAG